VTQPQVSTDQGDLRPDLVIQMPGGRRLVVDAKAPLEAYLESLEANDEALVRAKLADHARQLRDHVQKLSRKQYWEQFEDTPDFVILFIPGEAFYSAALEQDSTLIEAGVRQKVLLATPTTLIALLRTVAHTWRQEALAEDARRIATLGKELYDRLQVMANHWAAMGQALKRAVTSYNDAVGSLDTRVMPAARRFRELNIGDDGKEPVDLAGIESTPREVQSEELRPQLPRITPRDSR
jgi:DNA recombination protein RmuC